MVFITKSKHRKTVEQGYYPFVNLTNVGFYLYIQVLLEMTPCFVTLSPSLVYQGVFNALIFVSIDVTLSWY